MQYNTIQYNMGYITREVYKWSKIHYNNSQYKKLSKAYKTTKEDITLYLTRIVSLFVEIWAVNNNNSL